MLLKKINTDFFKASSYSSRNQIGSIDKNWLKAMEGLFRSPDKYNVNFKADHFDKNKKIAIFQVTL